MLAANRLRPVLLHPRRFRYFFLLLLLALPLHAKSLYWEGIDVDARLDSEGTLHVVERQTIIFDGDWNGGQRVFRLEPGQDIDLESIRRIDPATGDAVMLRKGDLDEIDEYKWTDSSTLRWRSRLPEDPPFESKTIIYELEYVIDDILVHLQENQLLLDHDFAFSDREGVIEKFRVDLEIDPVWQPRTRTEPSREVENLQPGASLVVTVPLEYTGPGDPPGVIRPAPVWSRVAIGIAVLIMFALALRSLVERERKRGRFAPLLPPEEIDRPWLEKNLFSIRPEVVGTLWDSIVSSPEVAAMLARLVEEKKLKSRVEKKEGFFSGGDVLHLELLVPRDGLEPAERKLIDALFPGKRTITSTEIVREHYKNRGFNPSSKIHGHLVDTSSKMFRKGDAKEIPPVLQTRWIVALIVFAVAAAIVTAVLTPGILLPVIVTAVLTTFAYFIIGAAAAIGRNRVESVGAWMGIPAALFLILIVAVLTVSVVAPLTFLGVLAIDCFVLGLSMSGIRMMGTTNSLSQIEIRKRLASARQFLARELRREKPDLEDAWFPWILAFGLGSHVDQWFRSFGGASSANASVLTAASGSSSSSVSSSGWSGGGGAFGGAGATSSWVGAATVISSGVSAPSSSGSGGGGSSGGGSSSGGGGGGGW